MTQMINMLNLQKSIAAWANGNIPDRTVMGAINKLVMEEIPELVAELKETAGEGYHPSVIESEIGDCFILLLDIANMLGVDAARVTTRKLEELKTRTWTQNPVTGFFNHN